MEETPKQNTKICSRCKEEKYSELFSKNKNLKDGLQKECKECKNLYTLKNKEKRQEYNKLNRQRDLEYGRNYIARDYNKWQNFWKEYNIKNKTSKLEYDKIWHKNKRKTDFLYKLDKNIRGSIKRSFNQNKFSKKSLSIFILGCTIIEFKLYLENKFESWMTWDNYGNPKDGILELNKTWDIDHIIPIASAKNEEDVIRLNYYTNFQPLCSYINRNVKKDKLNYTNGSR